MPLLRPQLTRLAFPWAMLSATQNFMSCCQIKSTVMAGLPFRDHLLVCNFHFPPTPHSIVHSYSDSPGTYTCTSTTETQIAYVLACLLLLRAEKLYHFPFCLSTNGFCHLLNLCKFFLLLMQTNKMCSLLYKIQ